ncbi:MAG: hypothetical protein A4E49_00476 [Methanosaeta sp. PtaU1.Bin112]|nr:MAG: hypothetical protein A4E49_00476 [Methanosaeta sp. PtaU1.Bin112]
MKNTICLLLISLALTAGAGCLAKDPGAAASPSTSNPAIPTANLPEGFKLLAVLPGENSNLNMTEYIEEFYGPEDIGQANVSVGIYKWKNEDGSYDNDDAKITLIELSDEDHAKAALSNFKSQDDYQRLLARNLPIFGNATVNGHGALEIKDIKGDNSIRYLYLWNAGNIAILVEGNGDRSRSLELASASGL